MTAPEDGGQRELRAGAFFDLDKTLIEGSSAIHFARAARRAGMMTRRQLASDLWANIRFRLEGASDEATEQLLRRLLESIAGHRVVDLARLGPEVLAGLLPRVYPQMLELAHSHQDAGRAVYIVTAASQEIADVLAHVFLFDGAIGMRVEQHGGIYTGRLAGPFTYGQGKAEALREVAARERIDLASSYAYSDSASDMPMLRCVGHPVAVNPDADLLEVACDEGWQVMRFDRLARRLHLAATLGGGTLLAGAGGYAFARLRPTARRRRALRLAGR